MVEVIVWVIEDSTISLVNTVVVMHSLEGAALEGTTVVPGCAPEGAYEG